MIVVDYSHQLQRTEGLEERHHTGIDHAVDETVAAGHEDHRDRGIRLSKRFCELNAADIAHHNVGENHVEWTPAGA